MRANTRPTGRYPIWLVQRISALVLGPLILLHVWVDGMTANAVVGSLLLLSLVIHMVAAFLRMGAERTISNASTGLVRVLILVIGLVILGVGFGVIGSLV
ncbi:MAG: hypothetical protein WD273_03065 [Trueperaceae bacterium]